MLEQDRRFCPSQAASHYCTYAAFPSTMPRIVLKTSRTLDKGSKGLPFSLHNLARNERVDECHCK